MILERSLCTKARTGGQAPRTSKDRSGRIRTPCVMIVADNYRRSARLSMPDRDDHGCLRQPEHLCKNSSRRDLRPTRCTRKRSHLRIFDIMPRSPGHTLVIPKAPARGLLDISADDFAQVARTTKKIAVAAVKAFHADGVISSSEVAAARWLTAASMPYRGCRSASAVQRSRPAALR